MKDGKWQWIQTCLTSALLGSWCGYWFFVLTNNVEQNLSGDLFLPFTVVDFSYVGSVGFTNTNVSLTANALTRNQSSSGSVTNPVNPSPGTRYDILTQTSDVTISLNRIVPNKVQASYAESNPDDFAGFITQADATTITGGVHTKYDDVSLVLSDIDTGVNRMYSDVQDLPIQNESCLGFQNFRNICPPLTIVDRGNSGSVDRVGF